METKCEDPVPADHADTEAESAGEKRELVTLDFSNANRGEQAARNAEIGRLDECYKATQSRDVARHQ